MAAIWTPGMARAALAWVCVMLPEPIRPTGGVRGGDRMIRNLRGRERIKTEGAEVGAQRVRRKTCFDGIHLWMCLRRKSGGPSRLRVNKTAALQGTQNGLE